MTAAERRETILRAATEVFAEAGYRSAKVSGIAARVGVTEPVVFQNFGSKGALFAAVVERAAQDVRESLDEAAAGSGSAASLLAHVLSGPAHPAPGRGDVTARGSHVGTAYGVLFADAAALAADAAVSEPARQAVRAVAAHLADLVRLAQADGGVRADTDPQAAAWLLLSLLSARRLRAVAMPDGLDAPDDLEAEVMALGLQALGAQPEPAGRPPDSGRSR